MPFCDGCDEIPFRNAAEVLDFAEQVLSVDSCLFWFMEIFTTHYDLWIQGLCFLHDRRMAQEQVIE